MVKPRVALDLFGCDGGRVTGWERYAQILYSALVTDVHVELTPIHTTTSSTSYLRAAQALWHFSHLREAIATSGADLYHSTSFPLLKRQSVPTVWSVHDDLIVGGHPQYASRGSKYWKYPGRRSFDFTDAIVTSTKTCAQGLVAAGASESKMCVVRPPQPTVATPSTAPTLVRADGTPALFPEEFLLCVGTVESRKRPELACSIAAASQLPLVFVGRTRGVDPRSLPGRVLLAQNSDDQQLSWCYHHARALLAVSAYEGIDLPLFEALSVGTPVLASPIDVHKELAEGYVTFISDADPIGSAISALREMSERVEKITLLSSHKDLSSAHVSLYETLLRS